MGQGTPTQVRLWPPGELRSRSNLPDGPAGAARRASGRRLCCDSSAWFWASVSLATRGQTDMRGLGTAGRAVRLERVRVSRIERRAQVWNPVAAHRCYAGHSTRCHPAPSTGQLVGRAIRPSRPGTSTTRRARGRRRLGDDRPLPALNETEPSIVQAMVPGVAKSPSAGEARSHLAHDRAGVAVGLAVMPCGLDKEPPGVGVAGLGDRALHP